MSPPRSRAKLLPQPSPLRRTTGPAVHQAHDSAVVQQANASPRKLVPSLKLPTEDAAATSSAAAGSTQVQIPLQMMIQGPGQPEELQTTARPTLVPPLSPFACIANDRTAHEEQLDHSPKPKLLPAVLRQPETTAAAPVSSAEQGNVITAPATSVQSDLQEQDAAAPHAQTARRADLHEVANNCIWSAQAKAPAAAGTAAASFDHSRGASLTTEHPATEQKGTKATAPARSTVSASAAAPKQPVRGSKAISVPVASLPASANGATATSKLSDAATAESGGLQNTQSSPAAMADAFPQVASTAVTAEQHALVTAAATAPPRTGAMTPGQSTAPSACQNSVTSATADAAKHSQADSTQAPAAGPSTGRRNRVGAQEAVPDAVAPTPGGSTRSAAAQVPHVSIAAATPRRVTRSTAAKEASPAVTAVRYTVIQLSNLFFCSHIWCC